jgi:alkaline phosphatase D
VRLSRRTFLALSATIVVGCSSDGEPATESSGRDEAGTTPPDSDGDTIGTDTTTVPDASTTVTTEPAVRFDADPFTLGVASGDPDATSVVLWTRLTAELPPEGVDVTWTATDVAGAVVASGATRTSPDADGAVHVVAELPVDGPTTFRFSAGGFTSPEGSTRPLGSARDELRLATASCQHYETGFYAAHRDLAEWAPDLVLFLGDFIYEGAAATGPERVRSHEGGEVTDVAGYRARYATYLSDPDLQAARAAAPWLVIWDDHEVENDYAGLVPQDPADAAGFAARRAAAYRVWWEHTPTRLAAPDVADEVFAIHRGLDVGDLVRISAIDGRQYRSDQVCDVTLDVGPPCPGWDDATRTMLGAEQEAWLADRFATTGARWNCVAQQTVMTDLRFGDTGAILNYDQWDGYAPARDRLLAGAPPDLVVLTGDIHLAGVGLLGTPAGPPTGVEFVTTSVSSLANVPPDLQPILAGYSNVVDAELLHRGYTRHTVTPDTWTAEFRIVDDPLDASSTVSTWKTFRVDRGTSTAVEA